MTPLDNETIKTAQSLADEMVAVDGNEELTIFIAPVGKVVKK
ncbi:hypothetical protein [Pelobacter propionicus]|nr:hypothetical protein [Pelobacter propionicus]